MTLVHIGSRVDKEKAQEALQIVHAIEAEAERKVSAACARADAAQEEMERLRYRYLETPDVCRHT